MSVNHSPKFQPFRQSALRKRTADADATMRWGPADPSRTSSRLFQGRSSFTNTALRQSHSVMCSDPNRSSVLATPLLFRSATTGKRHVSIDNLCHHCQSRRTRREAQGQGRVPGVGSSEESPATAWQCPQMSITTKEIAYTSRSSHRGLTPCRGGRKGSAQENGGRWRPRRG